MHGNEQIASAFRVLQSSLHPGITNAPQRLTQLGHDPSRRRD
jgi:hypothetical protein